MGSSCMRIGKKDFEPQILPADPSNDKDEAKQLISQQSTNLKILDEERKFTRHSPAKIKHKAPKVDARKSIDDNVEALTAVISDKPKSPLDRKMILETLNSHFILKNLDNESINLVVENMKLYEIGPREVIFDQGSPGQCFYVLCTGRVELLINGHRKDVLKPGVGFGELALLDDRPRSGTVRTIERCTLWGVDRVTFKDAVKRVNALNHEENKRFIDSIPLFNALMPNQKDALLTSLVTQWWNNGQKIVKEGDEGDLFYIIKQGIVSCTEKGREIRQMTKGDYFGEIALLYNTKRTATIAAIDEVKVVSIGREALIEVLGNNLEQILYRNTLRIAVEKSNTLKGLSKEQKELIFDNMKVKTFYPGEVVIPRETLKGNNLWVVTKGSIRGPKSVIEIFACIGDDELFSEGNEPYAVDFIAELDTVVAHITKEEIEKCTGGRLSEVQVNNEAMEILKTVQLLRGLTQPKLAQLVQALKEIQFIDQEVIFNQNDIGHSFYIIKSGKVSVAIDGVNIRMIGKHDYFGERSLLFHDTQRSATVVANGPVACWVLNYTDFWSIVDERIRSQLMKRIELQDDTISFNELLPVKLLGKGNFGSVYLAAHKTKRTLYALKTVLREKIQAYEIYENILLERRIMLQLDHCMVVKLVKTFKDDTRLYFLMEYVRGLDLFDVLRNMGLLNENDAKFYTACLCCILEHLHERELIYRDLKPENVMIDEEGYPKLIDFGTAKFVHGRTYTTVGTPHYMAPEIIVGSGYSALVDWWSLGIMVYEFIFGSVPFGEEEDEPYEVYQRILEHRLQFPNTLDPTSQVKPLIQQLLSKSPAIRTGGSTEKLREHKWFRNFNWDQLLLKQKRVPYIPKLKTLENELNNAFKSQKNLMEVIMKYEKGDRVEVTRKKPKLPKPNWDSEF
ncbi:PKG_8 [Blepharisma stoltei]|uniref:cGMP-dependent protein kinase n=1 Tax=Blepharisma stoltei TaxID=1481888 RepID=A0AAU9IGN1_9CILI|nr:unnamed protein product [Blepharisma stoltei]